MRDQESYNKDFKRFVGLQSKAYVNKNFTITERLKTLYPVYCLHR